MHPSSHHLLLRNLICHNKHTLWITYKKKSNFWKLCRLISHVFFQSQLISIHPFLHSHDESVLSQGRLAQSITCLIADPGNASSLPAQSHTFVEIDLEIISTATLLPAAHSRRVVVSYKWKYVHKVLVYNCLVKLAQEKSVISWTDCPNMTIDVDWDIKEPNQTKYSVLLYDWRESCLLIGPIRLHKSLCLPGNWSNPVNKLILHENQLELVSRS